MILEEKDTGLPHTWVATTDELVDCCNQLSKSDVIAIDTEFMRTDTFYPIAALIQIADDKQCYLIDPTTIHECVALVDLLTNPKTVKLIHACSEDLEVFKCALGCVPSPIIDTQIAAALAGYGASLGYANLVNQVLGIELEKGETRSDWLQRPLTERQIHYAIQDVEYLLTVWRKLASELEAKGRMGWLEEDCKKIEQLASQPDDIDGYYKRIKSAWKLSTSQLNVLSVLSAWREKAAREENIPRNHLVHERALYDVAKIQPSTPAALKQIQGLGQSKVRKYGDAILACIEKASHISEEDRPSPLPSPLPVSARDKIKVFKQLIAGKAEALGVQPELLMRKVDYEALVRSGMQGGEYTLPNSLSSWRKALFGDDILTIAKQ
ncbi:ribonuclease D [Aurantivibrio plasticivorans]